MNRIHFYNYFYFLNEVDHNNRMQMKRISKWEILKNEFHYLNVNKINFQFYPNNFDNKDKSLEVVIWLYDIKIIFLKILRKKFKVYFTINSNEIFV